MQRQTAIVLAIALLSVLAVGFAAATVSETVQTGAGGDGGSDGGLIDLDSLEQSDGSEELGRILLVLLGLAIVAIVLSFLDNSSETYEIVSFLVVPAVVVVVSLFVLAKLLGAGDIPLFGSGLPGSGDGAGDVARTAIPPLAIVGVFAIVLLLLVAFRRADGSTGSGTEENAEQTESSADPEKRAAVGEIAGHAADRIEAVDESSAENEVYRAWEEMVDRLDARREPSTTPREFARIATDAGLSPDEVDELTTLFEDVRYGGYSPTTDREQRAVSVLRRIEAEYG